MGIHGIYKEIGPGTRISLAKLSAEHYTTHGRCFRLAIDISIWLFQIQSGKGGSNPALRTFYYRLLRLLSLNIHPLFVFDGPNKPLFKRNKRVGGGGNVKVSSIPEFLAKQLLKQFGFPWHVAPGEAEAECALLQRQGLVDAVLSEDVDTLMFGSGVTLKSWTPEVKSSKVPTHVNVYRAAETKETSGLDRDGMILIALMSGGDYIPEGIPGCGPKLACDAARAGFGRDLVALKRKDEAGLTAWRQRLLHEIRTNESKHFTRKKPSCLIPDDFPNPEVLGYYTHPCVSGEDKLTRLKESLVWDLGIDFASLRTFAADAFDWRCLGGAKKFIRNLAPALLVRELRLRSESSLADTQSEDEVQFAEAKLISNIHSTRQHVTTDNTPELRISFTPIHLVDIDLSIEDPDEEFARDADEDSEIEAAGPIPIEDDGAPSSPKKKRAPSAYDPSVLEKVWLLDAFVRLGCPLKVQDWEATSRDPKEHVKAKAKLGDEERKRKAEKKQADAQRQRGAIERFGRITKPNRTKLGPDPKTDARTNRATPVVEEIEVVNGVDLGILQNSRAPASQQHPPRPRAVMKNKSALQDPIKANNVFAAFKATKPHSEREGSSKGDFTADYEVLDLTSTTTFAQIRPTTATTTTSRTPALLTTPTKSSSTNSQRPRPPKRPSTTSPHPAFKVTQPSTPRRARKQQKPDPAQPTIIDLLSSPAKPSSRNINQLSLTPTPPNIRHKFIRSPLPALLPLELPTFEADAQEIPPLPDTVTRRRRRRSVLKRYQTAPVAGEDGPELGLDQVRSDGIQGVRDALYPRRSSMDVIEAADPALDDETESLPSPTLLFFPRGARMGSIEKESAPTILQDKPIQQEKKKRIRLRTSLLGAWEEVDAVDLTGDGSGCKLPIAKAMMGSGGWRKSEVEVLDLTGA